MMGANEKAEAAYHPSTPAKQLTETDMADWVCEQADAFTVSGGNDINGIHVLDAELGNAIAKLTLDNGQTFIILVTERKL